MSIVLSSRVRLARTFAGYNFPHRLDEKKSTEIVEKVRTTLGAGYTLMRISDLTPLQCEALKERHVISDDLLRINSKAGVLTDKSGEIAVMVNEEDHLRAQCLLRGKCLDEAYKKVSSVCDKIGAKNEFAFDKKLGYLTACPTNVGTGLRASALMFLPGLTLTRSLESCINAVGRFDMTVRGSSGEGSESEGYLYQISNQKTLGRTEKEILTGVNTAIDQIEKNEITARKILLERGGKMLRDNVMRAYGVLTNAFILPTAEFADKLALVRLGIYYKFLTCDDLTVLDDLFENCHPASLSLAVGKDIDATERDIMRAEKVAETLSAVVKK